MHPSLNISEISKLPTALRMRASAAASGSHQEFAALFNNLRKIDTEQLPFLLPVFYATLSSARIPSILATFDASGWLSIKRSVVQGFNSICGLLHLARFKAIPPDAFIDLWKAVWPWVLFLHEYDEILAGTEFFTADKRFLSFMRLIRVLHDDEAANRMIGSPPSLYVFVGRAWRHLLDIKSDIGLVDVSHFLRFLFENEWNSAAFDDLIVGCGGTMMDLVTTVVLHIQRTLPSPNSPITPHIGSHLLGVHRIINCAVVPAELGPPLQNAFLSCGIVTALTTASRALCGSTDAGAVLVLKGFIPALVDHISAFPSTRLAESLRAGLLDVVFTSQHREAISPSLTGLFEHILLPATVYHSALSQLQASLPQVRSLDVATVLSNARLVALWKNFVNVAENRFRILNEYNKGTLTAPRGCDDLECAKICPKQDLKRCSGCLTTYYCSETCQTNDWKRGGHRETCGRLSMRRKELYSRNSTRDRSFLRTLLSHERTRRREEIAQKHLAEMRLSPDEILCTVFDFTIPTPEIIVGPLECISSLFEFEVERAAKSHGQMELHAMKVLYGNHGMVCVWPFLLHVGTMDTIDGGS
ncbi:MYND-type domain-containing protein [Mycena sanguinolenta]|uniref:MYND-type domain-containing protein n=1 Tax=Mycena sanguinolenta TaxID=230812 RepID=A0A8H7CRZ6_9AGAR|nr:MYND-type domain-containing protein [Mycena sanguinolenta]